jgi:trans-aconitate methyltransferase
MSYTIDERNPERQQLLAKFLEPPTRTVLAHLPRMPGARVLDLGSGQGSTTRCLAAALDASECVGVEYDIRLVDYAQTRPENPPSALNRIYRLSAEATGPAAAARGILTPSEVEEMITGLVRLEDDGSSVVVKFPDMWVMATKSS